MVTDLQPDDFINVLSTKKYVAKWNYGVQVVKVTLVLLRIVCLKSRVYQRPEVAKQKTDKVATKVSYVRAQVNDALEKGMLVS